jgi:hypothetical protein
VETIALPDGDLRWVFPDLEDTDEVLDLVHRAAAEIRLLADHLGVRPSWTGSGIEFHRLPSGPTFLLGSAEAGDVSFVAHPSSRLPSPRGPGTARSARQGRRRAGAIPGPECPCRRLYVG